MNRRIFHSSDWLVSKLLALALESNIIIIINVNDCIIFFFFFFNTLKMFDVSVSATGLFLSCWPLPWTATCSGRTCSTQRTPCLACCRWTNFSVPSGGHDLNFFFNDCLKMDMESWYGNGKLV